MHIAHDSYMSKVSTYLRPKAYQSGMYIRSRMSPHVISNTVYGLRTCMSKVNIFFEQSKHSDLRNYA